MLRSARPLGVPRARLVLSVLTLVVAQPLRASAEEAALSVSPHPPAAIEHQSPADEAPSIVPKYASGFLLLNGALQSVPSAVARERSNHSLSSTLGVFAFGTPWERWEYLAYALASADVSAGNPASGGLFPEQITLQYKPIRSLGLTAGYLRIPFSVGQANVIASSMFPTRPEASSLFHSGADAGFLVSYEAFERRVQLKTGVFDGLSLRSTFPHLTTIGPVVAVSTEVSPLGELAPIEADFGSSPFRFSLGGGMLYRDGRAYDPAGYRALKTRDVRVAVALRLAVRGLYIQAEGLFAQRSDDLSMRPVRTRGAYGEASYYVAIKRKVGLSPLGRLSWSALDEGFFPVQTVSTNAGVALYPRADAAQPGALRIVIQYQSERRIEEPQTAYGALASVMYRF